MRRLLVLGLFGAFALVFFFACTRQGEGLDPQAMPEEVRAEYDLFAQRCSRCHSLSRPLNAGITDDEAWKIYVTRMRRQPGSGITEQDQTVILRFLHYYSQEQLKKKTPPPAPLPPPSASPPSLAPVDGGVQ